MALVLARVIGCLPLAISLQSWYISDVSRALVICLICTPMPSSPRAQVYISGKSLGYMIQKLHVLLFDTLLLFYIMNP